VEFGHHNFFEDVKQLVLGTNDHIAAANVTDQLND